MKRFGLGRKGDGDDDSSRSALFGSRAKNPSPAPAAANPYAQPSGPPDPYTQAKIHAGAAPPGDRYGAPGRAPPQDNGPSQTGYGGGYGGGGRGGGGYGSGVGGYSNDRYNSHQGYGADRYGGGQGNPTGASRYGPGGYGGLGRTNSNDTTTTDDNRDALFGGARERIQQRQPAPGAYDSNPNQSGGYGGDDDSNQSYGAYQDRQLTAEEEEEEDVTATKQEIRFVKQQDVSSTRNALRVAAEAEETGRNTLARLGAQGERIHNTERNLDLAANHQRLAEAKARELKTLNRSMFAVHVANPFTGNERRRRRDEDLLDKHREEREERERSRQSAFETNQRMDRNFRDLQNQGSGPGSRGGASLAERAKYQFEADSEDDEMENEIDSNLTALGGAAGRLNALARATGEEIEAQNKHLDRIAAKSDRVDDQIHMNRARLDRIH